MCKNLNTSNLRTRLRKNLCSNSTTTKTRWNINLKLPRFSIPIIELIGKTPTKISLTIVSNKENTLGLFYTFTKPCSYTTTRMSEICLET